MQSGQTALIIAAIRGYIKTVQELLRAGANVHLEDEVIRVLGMPAQGPHTLGEVVKMRKEMGGFMPVSSMLNLVTLSPVIVTVSYYYCISSLQCTQFIDQIATVTVTQTLGSPFDLSC